jgi:general L-amino acid transport system permease protein
VQTDERLPQLTAAEKPPWYRDVRVLRVIVQLVIVVGVVAIAAFFIGNMVTNMQRLGISLSFDYLTQPAEFTIPGSDLQRTDTRLQAVLVGVGNTFRIAIAGILFATILGVFLGIARLSKNWLLSTGARLYVEFFRNIPLLVIIIFTYLVVFLDPRLFPRFEGAREIGPIIVYVRGVFLPWYESQANFFPWVVIMLIGVVAGVLVGRWRERVSEKSGASARSLLWGIGTFLVFAVVGYIALGRPVSVTIPGFEGKVVVGGIRVSPEYAALLVSLVLYTASHIAEITRGSIQSVPKGQHEAATALALSSGQRIRYVILPQAFRVAIPPLANQYLNLTKNSSLAVAIAYYEVTKVTTDIIGNGGPAPQSFLLLMFIYLIISLIIASLSNIVNRRLALIER